MVSVIIPSYNHGNFLKQRIESVLNQTYKDFEVIILDDCSSDNSCQVIEQYKSNPHVSKIIYNDQNSGSVFKQWEKGIALANGKYTWIAESDDYADKEFLTKLVAILDEDESLGLAYCNAFIVDENNKIGSRFPTHSSERNFRFKCNTWNNSFKYTGELFLKDYLSRYCVVNNVSAVLFRSKNLSQLSFNISDYKFAGDWNVYIDLLMHSNVYYLHESLSYYRRHPHNASKGALVNNYLVIEQFQIISKYYNWALKKNYPIEKYIDDIKLLIVPSLIKSKRRISLFKHLKYIDQHLLYQLLPKIPDVFIYITFRKLKSIISG